MAAFFVTPGVARDAHHYLPVPLVASAYLWHLLIVPLSLVAIGLSKLVPHRHRPQLESRRRFLSGVAAVAPPVLTGLGVGASLLRMDDFRVRRLEVGIPGLPKGLDGATIAHVSDLHVGKFTRPETLDRIVDAINGLRADLVLFTGDLIDLSLTDLPLAVETMKRLDPREGFFLCEGNHDLIDDPEGFRQQVGQSGLNLLLDETATVRVRDQRVQVLGSRWRRSGIGELGRLREPGAFPILLAHHPHAFDAATSFPLTLAGHTHGGQLMLNERLGAGPVLFRYWSGLYRRGDVTLVVSNGVGNWFPLRTAAPAELLHLTLRPLS
ncbi:MAG: metallophosphoesterase, partial [Planctomycetota bacterium]|jgi:predicted MPP superfamily phosphohydrolase